MFELSQTQKGEAGAAKGQVVGTSGFAAQACSLPAVLARL
jgi:hypothetical protein